MSSQEESEIMSETELYADWEGTYVAQDWVPDPMRIPGNPQWEICLHTVQLAQRKRVYEDPIGRTRSEAGMRIYRFSQSLHTATGPILLYRPHARDGEGPLEMAHWPPRLYRKVPPPVMMVVERIQESISEMHMHIAWLLTGERAMTITAAKHLTITWGKLKLLVDEKGTLVIEWVWLLNLSVFAFICPVCILFYFFLCFPLLV